MINSRHLTRGLTAAATLSMLAACGPGPNNTDNPPAPSATPVPSATASPAPEATATPDPVETASPTPTATPVPEATATPDPNATTAPTPTALPSAQDDISVVEKTTFNGKVYDDTNAPLDGVTVKVKSLNGSVPYEAETTTAGGTYAFNNAPAGVQIEIMASRQGYTTRRRVEVLKSNKQGDPNANRYDFGSDSLSNTSFGVQYNALSDKPEVVMVTPGRNVAGVDPATSFVMKFSEPMDRKTVIDNFEVRAYTTETFSVDNSTTLTGAGAINTPGVDRVWDKAAFNASWNSDDTEVTLSFKEERILPTDKDSDKTPDYQVTLERQDSQLKDKSGITRASDYFKLTDGNFERSYKFSINTDEQKPTLSSLVAQTAENSGTNSDGDAIKVRFSERMIHYTLSPTIAGGKNGVTSQAAAANNGVSAESAAANYKVTVIRSGTTLLNQATWSSLGGKAIFDTNDPTHKTVLLLPKKLASGATAIGKSYGTTLSGTASAIMTDVTSESKTLSLALYDSQSGSDVFLNVSINDGLADEAAVASNLQTTLSSGLAFSPGSTGSAITVSGTNGTPDSLVINFTPNARYLGLRFVSQGATSIGDSLPSSYTLGGNLISFDNSGSTDLYKPGDNVIVIADTTILDPAGNSVDSSGDDASANAS